MRIGPPADRPIPEDSDRNPDSQSFSAHADYCRQSRRLRATLGHDPVRLYRQLKQLGRNSEIPREPEPASSDDFSAAGFAAHVVEQLPGSILPYSQRLILLGEAARRGIDRFEANLIIAAVQHRTHVSAYSAGAPARRLTLMTVAAVLLLQSAILAGCWWMTLR